MLKYLEKYEWYEKIFQTEVIWYRVEIAMKTIVNGYLHFWLYIPVADNQFLKH